MGGPGAALAHDLEGEGHAAGEDASVGQGQGRRLDAMEEAARYSVPLDRLQAAASRVIAARTHAEAGIVTCGASHALTLATAACICGWDVARMNRLPFTDGMPNEVIMPLHHISGYDHALQAAGARLISIDPQDCSGDVWLPGTAATVLPQLLHAAFNP